MEELLNTSQDKKATQNILILFSTNGQTLTAKENYYSNSMTKPAGNIRLGKMRADEQCLSAFGSLLHHRFRRTIFY
jgi:hypothetical protein